MRRGFTLIELMIAMSLVVILAAIATPRLHQSLDQARAASALEAIREIRTAYVAIGEPSQGVVVAPEGEVPAAMRQLLTTSAFRPSGQLLVNVSAMSDTLALNLRLTPNGSAGNNTLLELHRLLKEKHLFSPGRVIMVPLSDQARSWSVYSP
jgi:prepilin-type N-terminal cleavage/methylation domain-containing protein